MATSLPRPRTIVADCPWPETGGCNRGANAHYGVERVEDIPGIIQRCPLWPPESDAHLWLWATVWHLPAALWVMGRLGFRYVTSKVWRKVSQDGGLRHGLGQYQRVCHEYLLLGVRGSVPVPPPKLRGPSVVDAPVGRHSEKPPVFYYIIREVSPGPHAELFARETRPGWYCWGNELVDCPENVFAPADCDVEAWLALHGTKPRGDGRQRKLALGGRAEP